MGFAHHLLTSGVCGRFKKRHRKKTTTKQQRQTNQTQEKTINKKKKIPKSGQIKRKEDDYWGTHLRIGKKEKGIPV